MEIETAGAGNVGHGGLGVCLRRRDSCPFGFIWGVFLAAGWDGVSVPFPPLLVLLGPFLAVGSSFAPSRLDLVWQGCVGCLGLGVILAASRCYCGLGIQGQGAGNFSFESLWPGECLCFSAASQGSSVSLVLLIGDGGSVLVSVVMISARA